MSQRTFVILIKRNHFKIILRVGGLPVSAKTEGL